MAFNFRLILLSIFIIIRLSVKVNATCYFPNGALATNDSPCRDDTDNAACCGQGYTCLSNRICQASGDELQKPGATKFVRGSCTDKSWRSSSCPSFCIDSTTDNVGGGEGIAKCPHTDQDLYWCINTQQEHVDCDKKVNVLYFPGTPSAITTIGVSPNTTKIISSTILAADSSTKASSQQITASSEPPRSTNNASQPTNSAEDPSEKSTSQSAVIGGAVGGAAAVLLLGGLALWWFFTRLRKNKQPVDNTTIITSEQYHSAVPKGYPSFTNRSNTGQMALDHRGTKSVIPYEMSAAAQPQELSATPINYQRY